jgi:hypothetical protein
MSVDAGVPATAYVTLEKLTGLIGGLRPVLKGTVQVSVSDGASSPTTYYAYHGITVGCAGTGLSVIALSKKPSPQTLTVANGDVSYWCAYMKSPTTGLPKYLCSEGDVLQGVSGHADARGTVPVSQPDKWFVGTGGQRVYWAANVALSAGGGKYYNINAQIGLVPGDGAVVAAFPTANTGFTQPLAWNIRDPRQVVAALALK